jgi:hypothetical protein
MRDLLMLPSKRYERTATDVEAFLAAYRRLIAVADQIAPQSSWAMVGSRLDYFKGEAALQLVEETSIASGRASRVGNELQLVRIFNDVVNPIADWRNSLRPMHPVTPSLIENYCAQLIGDARQKADLARERESGLAGALARFVRFPNDVREAAGLESSAATQRGAFLLGVIAQVLAGLIVVGILALAGLLLAKL